MNKQKKIILVALFTALICAGSFIQIPLPTGIPIVIQDMLAMLSGLLLGSFLGGASVAVFLSLGIIGLPVFSGKAGLSIIIAGVTGGFLVGYFFASVIGGLFLRVFLSDKIKSQLYRLLIISIAVILSTAIVFVCGAFGFSRITNKSFTSSLIIVFLPYIFGTLIKVIVMTFIVNRFRPIIKNYLS
ncbi:MAG: biotin transporter BioY [Treponemataceae bacterium]